MKVVASLLDPDRTPPETETETAAQNGQEQEVINLGGVCFMCPQACETTLKMKKMDH